MDTVTIIKVISSLLYPVGLVVVFAVLGMFSRLFNWRRVAVCCYGLSAVVFMVFSNSGVSAFLVESLEHQHPQQALTELTQHDVAIVLGGGLKIPLPPAQYSQLTSGSERYWHAVRLYKADKVNKVLLAGGNLYTQNGLQGETYYAAQLLQEWGVPSIDILFEDQSRTTEQNKENVARLIAENEFKTALLVTSAIHMPRAYSIFKNLPIVITAASADVIVLQSEAPTVFAWLPSVGALNQSSAALHEYYGMWFAQLKALISSV